MKLLSKERDGRKVRCVYDPAKTPLHRLLLSGVLPAEMQQELLEVSQALDPILLFQQIALLQQAVFRCAAGCFPLVLHTPPAPLLVFSVANCAAGMLLRKRIASGPEAGLQSLYQEQERRKRVHCFRHTHKDPFEGEWEQIFLWLQANPEWSSGDIFRDRHAPLSRTLSTLANSHADAEACGK